jgi:hypothetical protein
VTHGVDEMRASVEEGFSSFEEVRIEPQEIRFLSDQVAVRLRGLPQALEAAGLRE